METYWKMYRVTVELAVINTLCVVVFAGTPVATSYDTKRKRGRDREIHLPTHPSHSIP